MRKAIALLFDVLSHKLVTTLSVLLALAATMRVFYHYWHKYFLSRELIGDEGIFLRSFELLLNEGWYEATAVGAAPFYNLCALLLYPLIKDPNYTLKAVGPISWLLSILVWTRFAYKQLNIKGAVLIQLVTLISMASVLRNHYFRIYNDGLFVLVLSLLFMSLMAWYHHREDKSKVLKYALFSALLLALAISTREIILLFLPGFGLIFLFLLLRSRVNKGLVTFAFLSSLSLSIGLFHFPALIERGVLSIEQKQPEDASVHWSQRLYLTVLEGRNYPATGEETLQYLEKHGEESLPRGYLKSLFFNPKLTVDNFFFSLSLTPKPFGRAIGLLFPLFFLGLFSLLPIKLEKPSWIGYTFLWVLFITFTGVLCIQLMQDMQFRRYLFFIFAIPVLTLGFYFNQEQVERKHILALMNINLLMLASLNIMLQGLW